VNRKIVAALIVLLVILGISYFAWTYGFGRGTTSTTTYSTISVSSITQTTGSSETTAPLTTSTVDYETLLTRKDSGEGGVTIIATLLTKEYLKSTGEDTTQYDLDRNVIFKIYVDTHAGSLLGYNFQELFFLRDNKGNVYPAIEWKDLALDSHHRSGVLMFAKFDRKGQLIIEHDTIYVELVARDVAKVSERTLRWDLPIPNVSFLSII